MNENGDDSAKEKHNNILYDVPKADFCTLNVNLHFTTTNKKKINR